MSEEQNTTEIESRFYRLHPCYDRSGINERTKEGAVWS